MSEAQGSFEKPEGGRLEIALLFTRVLLEVALIPLHLVVFMWRRRQHRADFQRALNEAAP